MSVSFADLGVPPHMVSSLAARGIDAPFPIQAATIPEGLAGRDLCGRAPTGSGKTIAFGIPMVLGIGKAKPRKPRGLVLVPTRELASQVCHELQLLAKPKGPWVEAFYGGVGFDRQIKALQRGVDIIVCCPGRLADLINQRYVSLEDVDFVVIDEADRMADMGFLPEVKRLLDQCSTKRQTVLFSATLDGDVDVLIKRYQTNPARHEFVADDEGGALAEHYFWKVDRLDRLKTASAVIKKLGPTVVFCRTKRGADRIATQLEASGVKSAAIHGDRSQSQRERALHAFHQGRVQALVATDVAARGIHVDGVAGVIHYDPPGDHKDYVHRSGRTARAGNRGFVVSLVAPDVRKDVGTIQKELGYPVGLEAVDLRLLDLDLDTTAADGPVRASASGSASADARPQKNPYAEADRQAQWAEPAGRDERDSRSSTRDPRPSRPATSRDNREPRRDSRSDARPSRPAPDDRRDRRDDRDRPAASERRPMITADPSVPTVADAERRPAARVDMPAMPAMPKVDRVGDLAPLADGQRRPSGAARRKAKRLQAAENARLGIEVDSEGWTDRDLRDGRSSRPTKAPRGAGAPSRGSRPAGAPKGAGAKRSASRSPGAGSAPRGSSSRGSSGRASGPSPSGSSRSAGPGRSSSR